MITRWYHATTHPDWLLTTQSADAWVHVGSHRAARRRGRDVARRAGVDGYWLWRLILKPVCNLHPDLWVDSGFETQVYPKDELVGFDGLTYLNTVEDEGRPSLYVKANMLEVEQVSLKQRGLRGRLGAWTGACKDSHFEIETSHPSKSSKSACS
ncbi:hypothetical protein GCM10009624_27070 [Gordonia sinesedis]